jgi:hypothetical protein
MRGRRSVESEVLLRPMTHGRFALSREWLISQASQLPLMPNFINQHQTCAEHAHQTHVLRSLE